MTQPPIDRTGHDRATESSPTQPWPAFVAPEPEPAARAAAAPPPGPGAYAPGLPFVPVAPEPGPGEGYTSPVAGAVPTTRGTSGSSRVLTIALGAAIMVGAVGIAFAAGRATAPASSASQVAAAQGAGNGAANGTGNGAGNGNGPLANGGPRASFDLNGNDGGAGGRPGDPDGGLGLERGFGRGGFGGLGISGTVTAVTPDSVSVQTDAGPVVTFGLDGTTTYHQQAAASASDVKTGSKVEVKLGGRVQPTQGANGDINLGTAGDVTVVP